MECVFGVMHVSELCLTLDQEDVLCSRLSALQFYDLRLDLGSFWVNFYIGYEA